MKIMVKLTVLMATLLLLTGVAFAQPSDDCSCYEITCTNLDTGSVVADHLVVLCFDMGEKDGSFTGLCNAEGQMCLFFDSMKKEALAYSETNPYGYLKFHGDHLYVVQGMDIVQETGGEYGDINWNPVLEVQM